MCAKLCNYSILLTGWQLSLCSRPNLLNSHCWPRTSASHTSAVTNHQPVSTWHHLEVEKRSADLIILRHKESRGSNLVSFIAKPCGWITTVRDLEMLERGAAALSRSSPSEWKTFTRIRAVCAGHKRQSQELLWGNKAGGPVQTAFVWPVGENPLSHRTTAETRREREAS